MAGCGFQSFDNTRELLAATFSGAAAHVFIGAAGIAVRAIAPLLRHKSVDPPVLVMDAGGRFAIPLLSGHWGGGNQLARHLASLLNGEAVVTTASDCLPGHADAALDLLARNAGLKIRDWDALPFFQALILEGKSINLYDPGHYLPDAPYLKRIGAMPQDDTPIIVTHWEKTPTRKKLLRLAAPVLHVGLGFRKGISWLELERCLLEICARFNFEPASIAALATVQEKGPDLAPLAEKTHVPLNIYSASKLAAISTPNPSACCGKRFAQNPFSVCESAAILSAGQDASLLVPKVAMHKTMTFAFALAKYVSPRTNMRKTETQGKN